jgi:hypothetical protein
MYEYHIHATMYMLMLAMFEIVSILKKYLNSGFIVFFICH